MKLRIQCQAKQQNITELQDTQHYQKMTSLGQQICGGVRWAQMSQLGLCESFLPDKRKKKSKEEGKTKKCQILKELKAEYFKSYRENNWKSPRKLER